MACRICGKPSTRHKIWQSVVYDYCNEHWVNDERRKQIEMKKMNEIYKKLMDENDKLVDNPYRYSVDKREIKKEVKDDRIIVRDDKLQSRVQMEYLKGLDVRLSKIKKE